LIRTRRIFSAQQALPKGVVGIAYRRALQTICIAFLSEFFANQ
jgi:hypothetical protein